MEPIFSVKGNGKLLLTGEYFVLDGAKALAIPAKYGQRLCVYHEEHKHLTWESYNSEGKCWFAARYSLPHLDVLDCNLAETANTLRGVLLAARAENPLFLKQKEGLKATIHLDFPNNWGLGSSSTLLYCIAQWAKVDPFVLSDATFGGSAYDIACAAAKTPIFYSRDNLKPKVEPRQYKPLFYKDLYFIHLEKKQNSRLGIQRYREKIKEDNSLVEKITTLTKRFYTAKSLLELEEVITEHENTIAQSLDLSKAKQLYFNDYWGEIKSLGAWGGDFVLVTNGKGEQEMRSYFTSKGFNTILSFGEMTL